MIFFYLKNQEIESNEESSSSEIEEQPELWTSEEEQIPEPIENPAEDSKLTYITYILWFCFWATCWMIAIELKFGIVFLLFSALFGIYFNTRTEPKAKNEISAYSVFNENCKSIKGTLTAEQFEREIRYGPTSIPHQFKRSHWLSQCFKRMQQLQQK